MTADLQSAPVGHLGIRPKNSAVPSSRSRPHFLLALIASRQQEPTMGIEPITCRLQGGCSTIELRRQS
jgi:hypothetical protein